MNSKYLSSLISKALSTNVTDAKKCWLESGNQFFYIDDVLPDHIAKNIRDAFPNPSLMYERKNLREHKFVAAQMDLFDPLLEAIVFAFQEDEVRTLISEITGIEGLLPDSRLYAAGLSLMANNHFLNPHLDNSHNSDRTLYRAVNLLYYVSPDWLESNGGNLELWRNDDGVIPLTIHSKFNRLVIMATNQYSWHSVSRVTVNSLRCCVSNYFFTKNSPSGDEYFHVTSFRGRPNQIFRNLTLKMDANMRSLVRKFFPRGIAKIHHIYKK